MTTQTGMMIAGVAAALALAESGGARAQTQTEQDEAPAFSPVTPERTQPKATGR